MKQPASEIPYAKPAALASRIMASRIMASGMRASGMRANEPSAATQKPPPRRAGRLARSLGGHLLDLLLPPRCLSCMESVDRHGTLCGHCWPRLRWLGAPRCVICGLPFAHAMGEGAQCGACLAEPPAAARLRSVLAYDAGSSRLVSRFKYQDGTVLAPVLAGWMMKAGQEVMEGADLIVPVPLHWRRLLWRRYNQAGLLAAEIARHSGLPMLPLALRRTRFSRPQASLSRARRLTNVQGLFRAHDGAKASLKGRCILLVDDVQTTGATLQACAKALLSAGAREVRCLTLARTL